MQISTCSRLTVPSLRRVALPAALLLTCLLTAIAPASAVYEYRYVEGERYSATVGSGLRKEGFTNWMRHPSHGAVMVLGTPGDWLEYDLKDLGPGPYYVYMRGLAWKQGCECNLLWDGKPIGRTAYAVPGTALKWSDPIGAVRGPGEHKLRIVRAPGTTQAPYIDAILLTTQAGYKPGDVDQDFASFTTPLPLLLLGSGTTAATIAPDPVATVNPAAGIDIDSVQAKFVSLGGNSLQLRLRNTQTTPRHLRLCTAFAGAPESQIPITAPPAASADLTVRCVAESTGATKLTLRILDGTTVPASGSYTVTIPNPVSTSLDSYAYPVGTSQAVWKASVGGDAQFGREVSASVVLSDINGKQLDSTKLPNVGSTASRSFSIGGLVSGRYRVDADFVWHGKRICSSTLEFTVFKPEPFETWEPVQKTAARGGVIYLNGKPFLGRLLYHAAADADTKSHGFNLVQCYGGDHNPLDGIQRCLDACKAAGMWGTVALFNNQYFVPGKEFNLDHIRAAVERFRNHPAVVAWDLVDEPEGLGLSPENVAKAADLIRQLDPNHIVWVNLCRVDQATAYLASQDLWSFDMYPIPSQGVFGYAPWLQQSDQHLRGKKVLGTCLQTYQYADLPGVHLPTPDQLRCTAYLHILHDYRWFGYYSYYDPEPAACLARDSALWSYTRVLNTELVAFAPVILDEAPWEPVASGLPTDLFQAAMKTCGGKRYLVAVSGSAKALIVDLKVTGKTARTLFESAPPVAINAGRLHTAFRPYEVHVYQIDE